MRLLAVLMISVLACWPAHSRARANLAACAIIGDSIATMINIYFTQCQQIDQPGKTAREIIAYARQVKPSLNVVVSAGTNSEATLARDLESIRRNLKSSRNIIWIVPIPAFPKSAVEAIAAKYGDKTAYFVPGDDGIHPADPAALAATVQAAMI